MSATNQLTLAFASDYDPNRFRLFEVDDDLLNSITKGPAGSVTIRGLGDDEAVLCDATRTFSVRLLETTNTVLLLPASSMSNAEGRAEVLGSVTSHYELTRVVPRLARLKELLQQEPIRRDEDPSSGDPQRLYSFERLSRLVQASNEELLAGLQKLYAVEFAGHWRLVEDVLSEEALEYLLSTMIENDWADDRLDVEAMERLMGDMFPVPVLRHVALRFGQDHHGDLFTLNRGAVARLRARAILRAADGREMRLTEFETLWTEACGQDTCPPFEVLSGEVVTRVAGGVPYVRLFPLDELPSDARGRFAALFAFQERWRLEELRPYISDLVDPDATLDTLLSKHTRTTNAVGGTGKLYGPLE